MRLPPLTITVTVGLPSPVMNWAGATALFTKQGGWLALLKSAFSPGAGAIIGTWPRLQLPGRFHTGFEGLFAPLQPLLVCACRLSASNATASAHEVIIVFISWLWLRLLVIAWCFSDA